jgi:hypothetical protein
MQHAAVPVKIASDSWRSLARHGIARLARGIGPRGTRQQQKAPTMHSFARPRPVERRSSNRYRRRTPAHRGRRSGRTATVDAEYLTKICDCHVLGHVETDDAPERAETKQPEVECDARNQAEHTRHRHLKAGSLHDPLLWTRRRDSGSGRGGAIHRGSTYEQVFHPCRRDNAGIRAHRSSRLMKPDRRPPSHG